MEVFVVFGGDVAGVVGHDAVDGGGVEVDTSVAGTGAAATVSVGD